MGTERDELRADLLDEHGYCVNCGEDTEDCECGFGEFIDAAVAAGWRKPRTVTTVGGLDALPVDSTVLDAKGFVYQKWVDLDEPDLPWWALVGDSRQYPARRITLPATVLHEGAQP